MYTSHVYWSKYFKTKKFTLCSAMPVYTGIYLFCGPSKCVLHNLNNNGFKQQEKIKILFEINSVSNCVCKRTWNLLAFKATYKELIRKFSKMECIKYIDTNNFIVSISNGRNLISSKQNVKSINSIWGWIAVAVAYWSNMNFNLLYIYAIWLNIYIMKTKCYISVKIEKFML